MKYNKKLIILVPKRWRQLQLHTIRRYLIALSQTILWPSMFGFHLVIINAPYIHLEGLFNRSITVQLSSDSNMDDTIKNEFPTTTTTTTTPFIVGNNSSPAETKGMLTVENQQQQYGQPPAQLVEFFYAATACCYIGTAAIGSLLSPVLLPKFGYKKTVGWLANFLNILGTSLQVAGGYTDLLSLIIVGRMTAGLTYGITVPSLATFTNDIIPPHHRGAMNSNTHVWVWGGTVLAVLVSSENSLGTAELWPLMFIPSLLISAVLLIVTLVMPESPAFLLKRRSKNLEAIKRAELFYFGTTLSRSSGTNDPKSTPSIESNEGANNNNGNKRNPSTSNNNDTTGGSSDSTSSWDLIKTNSRRICIGLVGASTSTIGGIMGLSTYFAALSQKYVGMDISTSQTLTLLFMIFSVASSASAIFTVEHWGRRPVMLCSLAFTALANFLLFLSLILASISKTWTIVSFLVGNGIFVIAFNCGTGPIANFIACELVPRELSELVQGVGLFLQLGVGSVSIFTFYPMMSIIGAFNFLIYGGINVGLLFILYYYQPETKVPRGTREETVSITQSMRSSE